MNKNELVVRRDEFSWQVSWAGSKTFFLRVELGSHEDTELRFSDFAINDCPTYMVFMALELARIEFAHPRAGGTVRVKNILPLGFNEQLNHSNATELANRHDKIVDIFRDFGSKCLYQIEDAFLHPTHDKYDTIIKIE